VPWVKIWPTWGVFDDSTTLRDTLVTDDSGITKDRDGNEWHQITNADGQLVWMPKNWRGGGPD
jgi:hypothetical protein